MKFRISIGSDRLNWGLPPLGHFLRLPQTYHDRGDFKNAIADFEQALTLDPDNAIAFYNRGEARSDVGDLQGAITDITQMVQSAGGQT